MGVRIVLVDKEPIGLALRRLKKALEREGVAWKARCRGAFLKPTQIRRAKKFNKRFKARQQTLLAKMAGQQPTALSVSVLKEAFWKRTGKP